MAPATIADVDAMGREAFVAALGAVVEHSPWVAERAHERRPFGTVERLHLAFEAAIREGDHGQVLNAHPELAARVALTPESQAEQRAARLDRLTAAEHDRLQAINARYRARFGFPFISCVREHSVASLLAWGEARLDRDAAAEQLTAIAEVGKIVGLRLRERVTS